MAGEIGLGIGTGAAQGAAAGSVFGGWGAAIGGVIGGIGGFFGGSKAKKAKKYMKKANAVQKEREQNAVEAQYLQMLREARMQRAGSLAASTNLGISTSSLSTSALSSIGSQAQYNVQFLGEDRRLFSLYAKYMEKAGQAVDMYKTIFTGLSIAPSLTSNTVKLYNQFSNGQIQPFQYKDIYNEGDV